MPVSSDSSDYSLSPWCYDLMKGIFLANKGNEQEKVKNYSEAIRLYEKSLPYFDDCAQNKIKSKRAIKQVILRADYFRIKIDELKAPLKKNSDNEQEEVKE